MFYEIRSIFIPDPKDVDDKGGLKENPENLLEARLKATLAKEFYPDARLFLGGDLWDNRKKEPFENPFGFAWVKEPTEEYATVKRFVYEAKILGRSGCWLNELNIFAKRQLKKIIEIHDFNEVFNGHSYNTKDIMYTTDKTENGTEWWTHFNDILDYAKRREAVVNARLARGLKDIPEGNFGEIVGGCSGLTTAKAKEHVTYHQAGFNFYTTLLSISHKAKLQNSEIRVHKPAGLCDVGNRANSAYPLFCIINLTDDKFYILINELATDEEKQKIQPQLNRLGITQTWQDYLLTVDDVKNLASDPSWI